MLPRLVLFFAMSQRVKRDYPETSIAFAPLVQRFDRRSDMPEPAIWSPTVKNGWMMGKGTTRKLHCSFGLEKKKKSCSNKVLFL